MALPQQGIKTSTRTLIRKVIDRLVAVTGLDENLVNFTRMQRNPRLAGDRDIVLRLTGARAIAGLMEAAAQVTPAITRGLVVQIRTRLNIDVMDRSNEWLMNEALGMSAFEDSVLAALCSFRPYDADDQSPTYESNYTIYELLLIDEDPYADELRQIPPDDPTWGSTRLVFGVPYLVTAPDLPANP